MPLTESITILNPAGGVTIDAGQSVEIIWTATGGQSDFRVQYSDDGGTSFTTLSASTSALRYIWDTSGLSAGTTYQVKVLDNTTGINDTTGNFTITTPTIAVISPNGGESFENETGYQLSWT